MNRSALIALVADELAARQARTLPLVSPPATGAGLVLADRRAALRWEAGCRSAEGNSDDDGLVLLASVLEWRLITTGLVTEHDLHRIIERRAETLGAFIALRARHGDVQALGTIARDLAVTEAGRPAAEATVYLTPTVLPVLDRWLTPTTSLRATVRPFRTDSPDARRPTLSTIDGGLHQPPAFPGSETARERTRTGNRRGPG